MPQHWPDSEMNACEKFTDHLADCLVCTGLSFEARRSAAKRILSEVETGQLNPASIEAFIAHSGRYVAQALTQLLGIAVRRVLLAPVPAYASNLIPALLAAGIEVHLADNFKAGQICGGLKCEMLDTALADDRDYDAHVIGTIDHGVGQIFRDRMPPATTLALGDIVLAVASCPPTELDAFRTKLGRARKPILFLAAYIDTTLVPTLGALEREGYDVFTITRSLKHTAADYARTDPADLSFGHHIVADFAVMVGLLDGLNVPVILHHAHFLTPRGNLAWSLPALAYGTALLRLVAGTRIVMLYDVVMTATRGFEAEEAAFLLYRQLLGTADGIIIGSAADGTLARLLDDGDKVLGFLRYGWAAPARQPQLRSSFHVAVVTHFLGERQDRTRATAPLIVAVLKQGIHLHYYVRSAEAEALRDSLDDAARAHLHLHEPIVDQQALIEEIGQYDAGWFVIDGTIFDQMAAAVKTPMARALYSQFMATTVGTAMLFYLAAGLPIFINPANSCGQALAAEGTAIPVTPETVDRFAALVAEQDWPSLRRRASAHRNSLAIEAQIGRLTEWLRRLESPHPVHS